MTKEEQIREGLKRMASEVGPLNSMLATVVSVDAGNNTCVLLNDDIEIYDVRLRPVLTANESATIYPAPGKWALAIRIEDDNEWMVIACEQADKVRVKTDTSIFEINQGFLIKKDNDTLKQVLTLVIEACQKVLVIQGNNPDYVKLAQALVKVNNLFK